MILTFGLLGGESATGEGPQCCGNSGGPEWADSDVGPREEGSSMAGGSHTWSRGGTQNNSCGLHEGDE